jgi:hypothetical protein
MRYLLICIFFVVNLNIYAQSRKKYKYKTGIKGYITDVSSMDLMPSPDAPTPSGAALATKVMICKPITMDGTIEKYIAKVPTKIISTTHANKKGFYKVKVPAGQYTILVKTTKGWYVSYVDGTTASPVFVKKGLFTQRDIQVTNNTAPTVQ